VKTEPIISCPQIKKKDFHFSFHLIYAILLFPLYAAILIIIITNNNNIIYIALYTKVLKRFTMEEEIGIIKLTLPKK